MGKHTPGPWLFRIYAISDEEVKECAEHGIKPVRMLTNDGEASILAGNEEDRKPVARAICQTKFKRGEGYKTDCAERDANARLIASAPDMLALLQKIDEGFRRGKIPDQTLLRRNGEEIETEALSSRVASLVAKATAG